MNQPKRIGVVIDEAVTEILGPAGFEFYAELVRQTQASRERIEREVRAKFQEVLANVFAELTGFRMSPGDLDLGARLEANRRIQAEIGQRISEEEQAFRERLNRLYGWAQGQKRKGCEDCGG